MKKTIIYLLLANFLVGFVVPMHKELFVVPMHKELYKTKIKSLSTNDISRIRKNQIDSDSDTESGSDSDTDSFSSDSDMISSMNLCLSPNIVLDKCFYCSKKFNSNDDCVLFSCNCCAICWDCGLERGFFGGYKKPKPCPNCLLETGISHQKYSEFKDINNVSSFATGSNANNGGTASRISFGFSDENLEKKLLMMKLSEKKRIEKDVSGSLQRLLFKKGNSPCGFNDPIRKSILTFAQESIIAEWIAKIGKEKLEELCRKSKASLHLESKEKNTTHNFIKQSISVFGKEGSMIILKFVAGVKESFYKKFPLSKSYYYLEQHLEKL